MNLNTTIINILAFGMQKANKESKIVEWVVIEVCGNIEIGCMLIR
jgi:hypothetical protein